MINFQDLEAEVEAMLHPRNGADSTIVFHGRSFLFWERFSFLNCLFWFCSSVAIFYFLQYVTLLALVGVGVLSSGTANMVSSYHAPIWGATALMIFAEWTHVWVSYAYEIYYSDDSCWYRISQPHPQTDTIDQTTYPDLERFYKAMPEADRPLFLQALKEWQPKYAKDSGPIRDVTETLRRRREELKALKDLDVELAQMKASQRAGS